MTSRQSGLSALRDVGLLAAVAVLSMAITAMAAQHATSTKVTLSPDEWHCTASHVEKHWVERQYGAGNLQADVACDQWSRK